MLKLDSRLRRRRLLLGLGLPASFLLGLALVGWCLLGTGLRFTQAMHRQEPQDAVFTVEEYQVPGGTHTIPMRVYRPKGPVAEAVLLAHGVHVAGYNEARLCRFARELARHGFLVAVPDLEDLRNYDLVPRTVDDIEAATRFLLDAPALGAAHMARRPAIYGVSFSGGLGLCAAARPSLRGRLGCVFSFGGHGDLGHVLQYLCTGELPNGSLLTPHLYGQAVLLRRFADRLVPPDQVAPLRASLFLFLAEKGEAFQASLSGLPPEARRVAEVCYHWDAKGVEALLRPLAPGAYCDPALSPLRGSVPDCPVFLLHGSVDNVIPPSETEAMYHWATRGTRTRALVTDLIRHVELEDKGQRKSAVVETYKLMRFMTKLLRS